MLRLDLYGGLLLVLHVTLDPTDAIIYGPSIELLTRSGAGTVTGDKPAVLYLVNHENNAVVLPLLDQTPTADMEQVSRLFTHPHRQIFYVRVPQGQRIIATIQALNLPTDSANECYTYVMFTDPSNGASTGRICGIISRDDPNGNPDSILGPRYFVSNGSQLAVLVKIPVLLNQTNDRASEEHQNDNPVTLEIAFTAFTSNARCPVIIDSNRQDIKAPCSSTPKSAIKECISAGLFCDGILNCAGHSDEDFGTDERNCTSSLSTSTATLDPEEKRILEEIEYRKMLRRLDLTVNEQINYIAIALAGLVTSALVVACACYWLVPISKKQFGPEENKGTEHHAPGYFDYINSLKDFQTESSKNRKVSDAPVTMPATLKVNPDGSHRIEAFHGNRRVTISVG